MSYKKATYIANGLIIALGIAFIVMAKNFPDAMVQLTIQPSYYPIGISALLILFCVISIVKTATSKQPDKIISFGKTLKVLITIALCILFGILWTLTRSFYIVSFIIVAALMYFLNPQPNSGKKVMKSLAYSLITQLVVYLVFQQLMNFRL